MFACSIIIIYISIKKEDSYKGNGNIGLNSSYKRVKPNDPEYFYIPIISTNNIQGNFYQNEIDIKNIKYKFGGLIYFLRYIYILKEEFGAKRLLYIDAGELYNKTNKTEFNYIKNFINYIDINNYIVGNLNKNAENFDNDLENNNTFYFFGNYKIYNIRLINRDIIKIGIIELIIKKEENYKLEDLIKEIKSYLNILQQNGVNAIIFLTNLEIRCVDKNLNLNMYINTKQICDEYSSSNNDIFNILKYNIPIDAIIVSNSYDLEIHHWVGGIPIMSSPSKGKYFNIMYLPFKKQSGRYFLKNAEIKIEGPIPICEKIFEDTKICDSEILSNSGENINFYWHDRKMFKDINLKKIEDKLK